jgi:hypothetical protein
MERLEDRAAGFSERGVVGERKPTLPPSAITSRSKSCSPWRL